MKYIKACFCFLLAVLTLCSLGFRCQAEEAGRSCTIRCQRTDELAQSLTTAGEFGVTYAQEQERFSRELPTAEPEDENYTVSYYLVEDVTIEVGGERVLLEDALAENKVTVDEIIADIRADATSGVCEEKFDSHEGVSQFTYTYPDVAFIYTCDVLEAPDGRQHPIRQFTVLAPGDGNGISYAYFDHSTPFVYTLDREDWGLDFQTVSADDSKLTLKVTQSGGQQFGKLVVLDYTIVTPEMEAVSGWEGIESIHEIEMEGSCEMTFDWTGFCDPLSPGDYYLCIHIDDQYDPAEVHPLARNFYDRQRYFIPFQVA